ncbi:hypothetical protein PHAVU_003G282800 [Phaseolus vulgaris]|uniref:FYR C-terminal domain-containing protein n=1 Tax=Phaseolus vulgaris TaxID=3885 RepID=V7CGA2_PHAVU|nr:hypothetical protein PHAVU_003G282800g [Phaseolus vulgaris]ESW28388.1 hypothetical protein PHAVU_003G282800g [Phaseolus vulgaris]
MAKTRRAEKAAGAEAEDGGDGLEIISIGSLYKGAWDKKYWTTTRGKDRYPYPVGYQAVRAYNGTTYKMEICEGVNGPKFLISCDDGSSSSGKTPDQPWEEFQKKSCPRIKIWHGKRLSSKMDGLEFFGFKNQSIQRLLRELVTNVNGIAERSLVSPNICEGVARTDHDDNCCPNVGTYPDLLRYLGKQHVTGKRSRCELKNKKLNVRARPQSPQFVCSGPSNVKNEKNHGQGSSTTHYGSEVHEVQNQIGVPAPLQRASSVCKSKNCISSKNDFLLNPLEISDNKEVGAVPSKGSAGFLFSQSCSAKELTENLSTEEPSLHRSQNVELKMSNLLVTSEDNKLMQSHSKETVGCIAIDLCAPDTLDFVQEYTPDSAPSELDENAYIETTCEITSEKLSNAEHEKLVKSNSNPCSEKGDFGSAGLDVANSMMSLLLPQAVPLLRSVSTDKELIISPADMPPSQVNSEDEHNKVGCSLDVASSDVIMIEAAHGEQGETIHGHTDPHSNTLNSEHMKCIVPDSFEYNVIMIEAAHGERETIHGHTDPHSNTLNSEHMKCIVPDSFEYSECDDYKTNQEKLSSDLAEAGRSSFNIEMGSQQLLGHDMPNITSKTHASGIDFEDSPRNFDVCIPESVLDDMSPKDQVNSERRDDDYSGVKENPAHVSLSPAQKDFPTAQDFTGGVSNAFSGDKFKLVTTQMYTTKDTLHSSEIILISNSNDKPCEPDDAAGLCVQTPQTCRDVLIEHSNIVEQSLAPSQNPTQFAEENKCFGTKEAQLISEPMPLQNEELKSNLGSSVKFVGCYLHPMPVSSLFLSTKEDEVHICVLCGHLTDQYRTLFTYKVAITEPTLGYPSVMAHSSILLPDPKHNFIKETMVERSGVQLTPGGQYIVLIGSIKAPNCREGKIDCSCSTCTSVFYEKNALKIVQVEHGYVSVVTTLETADNVHCILVCEPNRLVSVGESGKLEVWVMNSKWSEKTEHFIIPTDDGSASPGIVELKKVPKSTHLVVGHNSYGEFSLWDIAKCNCVARFSAIKSPINEFFPISLFQWQTKGSGFSYASMEEQADKLLKATNSWYSQQRETSWPSPLEENVAMWLFVSTYSDQDCCHNPTSTSSSFDIHTARSWRLALMMKNSINFGSPLNLRTCGIGVSSGYGIIGTTEGVVYMWELSKGSKLYTLHQFQDGNVACVATDNSRGALGVAGGGQLLLYLHIPELDSD